MSNRFAEIHSLVNNLEADFQKFYDKDNQAAGTRIRKGMQDLKQIAQEIRLQVQKMKNEREGEVEAPVVEAKPAAKAKAAAPKAEKAAAAPAKAEPKKKK
jgi:hypothetical protein